MTRTTGVRVMDYIAVTIDTTIGDVVYVEYRFAEEGVKTPTFLSVDGGLIFVVKAGF